MVEQLGTLLVQYAWPMISEVDPTALAHPAAYITGRRFSAGTSERFVRLRVCDTLLDNLKEQLAKGPRGYLPAMSPAGTNHNCFSEQLGLAQSGQFGVFFRAGCLSLSLSRLNNSRFLLANNCNGV